MPTPRVPAERTNAPLGGQRGVGTSRARGGAYFFACSERI
jgi:hypothetical protein